MISFFLLSLPIFAVIGVGWAATRTRLVAQGALDALNAFSFRFALQHTNNVEFTGEQPVN